MFGPSGEDRPDVLTDAETVVLPLWLHRRASSADGKTGASAASFLKTITVPAQEEARPGGRAPARDRASAGDATSAPEKTGDCAGLRAGTESVSDDRDVGAEAGDPGLGDPADG